MGVRFLFLCGICLGAEIALGVIRIPPKSLPVTIVKVEIGEPQATNAEQAPIENVRVFTPSATIHFPVAPEDVERANLRIQPILELGEERAELPWINASSIINYMNRIPSSEQVVMVQTEDKAWAKATPLGLVVDLHTEKITAAYQFVEWRISNHYVGNPDTAIIQIPIDEIGDRVLTRTPKLQLPERWQDQQFLTNYTGDKVVGVVVLAFEGAPNNGHKPGPLAPYIPSYKSKDHSAIVLIRAELEDMATREVGVYRLPIHLLRTVSKVDLEEVSKKRTTTKEAAHWMQITKIGSYRFDGMQESPDERFIELKRDSEKHFATSTEFDLTPATCTALIVREGEKAE